MASGDTIEAIEVVDSSINLNMNNSKDTNSYIDTGAAGEDEGIKFFKFINPVLKCGSFKILYVFFSLITFVLYIVYYIRNLRNFSL